MQLCIVLLLVVWFEFEFVGFKIQIDFVESFCKKKIEKNLFGPNQWSGPFLFFFLLRSPIRVGRVPPFFLTRKPRIPSPPLYKHPSPPISCAPFLLHLQPPPALAPSFFSSWALPLLPARSYPLHAPCTAPPAPRRPGSRALPPAPAPTWPLHAAPPCCCCLQRHLHLPPCAVHAGACRLPAVPALLRGCRRFFRFGFPSPRYISTLGKR